MASNSVQTVDLFGGAIKSYIPSGYTDVSDLRQVPDNQEVFLDKDGFTSITFDICERVTSTPSDKAALKYHFNDIVEEGDVKISQDVEDPVQVEHLPNMSALRLTAQIQPASLQGSNRKAARGVTVIMTLIRLPKQQTDFVINVNIPDVTENDDSRQERYEQQVEAGRDAMTKILQTLEIKNWGLFGSDD